MSLPEVKENETLQDYIQRAIAEGVSSSAVGALVANYNKK